MIYSRALRIKFESTLCRINFWGSNGMVLK